MHALIGLGCFSVKDNGLLAHALLKLFQKQACLKNSEFVGWKNEMNRALGHLCAHIG